MRYDLIIFDYDGVVADSEVLSSTILAEQLTALGMPTTLEDVLARYVGRRWRDNRVDVEARHGVACLRYAVRPCSSLGATSTGRIAVSLDGGAFSLAMPAAFVCPCRPCHQYPVSLALALPRMGRRPRRERVVM